MKLNKFLSLIFLLTGICLLYVYQQTEILRLAYAGQIRQSKCEELLDKNSILRYNIKRNISLAKISSRISGISDFEMPGTFQLVRVNSSEEGSLNRGGAPEKQTLLSQLFAIKRQAEAKTLYP